MLLFSWFDNLGRRS